MKAPKISKGLLLGLTLLLATSVFAANKGSFKLSDPVTINGTALAAGQYTATWEGTGPNVEVSIMHGKNVVATVPARTVDLNRAPEQDTTLIVMQDNGQRSLNEIRFSGKKQALALGTESAKADSTGATK
jgi:hypothetical protein